MTVSGKQGGPRAGQVLRFLFTVFILVLFMGGSLLGLFLYMEYLVSLTEREGFSEGDLLAPVIEERVLEFEEAPVFILPWEPGIAPECRLIIALNNSNDEKKLDGYRDIGVILNLSLSNIGLNRLYVERTYVTLGWGGEVSGDLGKYLDVSKERYMRHLLVPLPEVIPEVGKLHLTVHFDVLVERGDRWYRREDVEYPSYPINLLASENATRPFKLVQNPPYYYDTINDLVRQDRASIMSLVENSSLGQGNYTVQKIVDAYEFVVGSLEYIADPDTGQNQWISPMSCLERGGGDCEDYSILLGSIITAMGGNARMVITSGHAFNAVYIGDDDSVLSAVSDRYGLDIPFQVWEDELGKWLLIEPQSRLVFGWFPLDVSPVTVVSEGMYLYGYDGMSWGFADSDEISVVDIYFK